MVSKIRVTTWHTNGAGEARERRGGRAQRCPGIRVRVTWDWCVGGARIACAAIAAPNVASVINRLHASESALAAGALRSKNSRPHRQARAGASRARGGGLTGWL